MIIIFKNPSNLHLFKGEHKSPPCIWSYSYNHIKSLVICYVLKKMRLFYIQLWKLLFSINSTLWIFLHPVQDRHLISFKSCIVYDHMIVPRFVRLRICLLAIWVSFEKCLHTLSIVISILKFFHSQGINP